MTALQSPRKRDVFEGDASRLSQRELSFTSNRPCEVPFSFATFLLGTQKKS